MDSAHRPIPSGPVPTLFLAALVVLASGCGDDDGGRRVRLVLTIGADVPDREGIDEIEVTLTASRTDGTEALALCEPTTCRFPTAGGRQAVVVDFHRGSTYTALALFRVAWLSAGTPRATREMAIPWPDSGTREVRLELRAACEDFGCGPGLQCLLAGGDAVCAAVPFPDAFDERTWVDDGVPCGRGDEPTMCPALDAGDDADAGPDADGDGADDSGGDADVGTEAEVDGDTGDGDGEGGETADGDAGPTCTPPAGTCPAGMAFVAGGAFVMGSDPGEGRTDEEPEHVVTVSGYCIDLAEVTNGAYLLCIGAGGCSEPGGGAFSNRRADYLYDAAFADYPVVNLDWGQARDYCAWAGKRLPTEAEWEKACRGGCEAAGDPAACDASDERTYPWGEEVPTCDSANFNACLVWEGSDNDTDRVGSRPAGTQPVLCTVDMAGNAREFVADWFASGTYSLCPDPCTDPAGPATGDQRVTRGGSFFEAGALLKCARREPIDPGTASAQVGFRCAMAPPP
ncbi:MAG: SUMF1/EgtB/PvdO family nonheme iron enzyme [Deltaproteobacteria bacterium]|nr:SUMF1/EgtB/PvdO family nonheme iron enzyme [Deltaproteobacteria bacterium]